ncbi:MAG: tRNA lysidine(34) synthetase TilS [Bacillota bacterium]
MGLSGGLDSVVLLDLLVRERERIRLSAVHVHHGLSKHADEWADFCRRLCAERGIELTVERVRVDRAAREGLEAAARAARYAVYASLDVDCVALAHHRDDQAETVLLQLLRGTGLKGIAAMPGERSLPASRVRIVRPLLDYPRSALEAYARERGLEWIDDDSNASLRIDRNFLRHAIAPKLDERFAGWREAATRFARHAASADALLVALARIDGLPDAAGEPLAIDPALPDERRANLLRAFFALNALDMPSEARLNEIARQAFAARSDARVRIEHAGALLVRHRDRLHIERPASAHGPWHRPWHGEPEVDLGAPHGSVSFQSAKGEGLSFARIREPGWHFAGRAGGERLRLSAHRPTRTLKNLFQEHDIPLWERERMPLLFHRERLVWVPDIGIDIDYACKSGEAGMRPVWTKS